MAQNANLASTTSLGDLVPVLHTPNGNGHAETSALNSLLNNLHSKSTSHMHKHWQVDTGTPADNDEDMRASANTCVVQMLDKTVGVLKVAANGGCTLFVRLSRPHASQMADRDKVPRDVARTFRRELSVAQAAGILRGARPFCLKAGEVHHPHALSLLCSMTRAGWLALDAAPGYSIVVPSCTLVALTPLPRNFEQCLVLMGWKAAYMPADEALWTAQAVDRSVWGETHDDFFVGDVASKFADAARELSGCADPAVFTQHIPHLNSKSRSGGRALDAVQSFLLTAKAFSTIQPPRVASHAAEGAPTVPVADDDASDEMDMAPSDEDEGVSFVLPVRSALQMAQPEPEPAPTPVAAPSATPSPKPKTKSSSRGERRRARRDDESDTQEQDEKDVAKQDSELQEVVSTDSESESDSGHSGEGYSDNDDDEDSGGGGGDDDDDDSSESDSASQPLADKPIAKNNEHTPTTRTVAPRGSKEASVPGTPRLSEAEWLVEFARPCCKRIEHFKREHRALIAPERMALIDADLQQLQKPDSVPALLGAALSLVGNMAASHSDAPPEDAMPLGAVGRKRVRELAVQATDFSELTLARVNGAVEAGRKMLEQLEDLRKRGRALLGSVESACANGDTADGVVVVAAAPAEASQQA